MPIIVSVILLKCIYTIIDHDFVSVKKYLYSNICIIKFLFPLLLNKKPDCYEREIFLLFGRNRLQYFDKCICSHSFALWKTLRYLRPNTARFYWIMEDILCRWTKVVNLKYIVLSIVFVLQHENQEGSKVIW